MNILLAVAIALAGGMHGCALGGSIVGGHGTLATCDAHHASWLCGEGVGGSSAASSCCASASRSEATATESSHSVSDPAPTGSAVESSVQLTFAVDRVGPVRCWAWEDSHPLGFAVPDGLSIPIFLQHLLF